MSLRVSLAEFSKFLAKFAFNRENSIALSLVCCIVFFQAFILANMTLFANLVAAIVLSVILLTVLA